MSSGVSVRGDGRRPENRGELGEAKSFTWHGIPIYSSCRDNIAASHNVWMVVPLIVRHPYGGYEASGVHAAKLALPY